MVDHGDLIGQAIGLVEVLRGQQDGRAAGDPGLDRLPQGDAAARVEAGGRLVEEEHGRRGDQRGGEIEAPAHPAGVGLRQPVGRLVELELLEQLAARFRDSGAARW